MRLLDENIRHFDWYEIIEEPIRELVFLLRNNGFNTECSCGHEMNIQFQYIPDGKIHDLYKLVSNYLFEKQIDIDFDITINIKAIHGHQFTTMNLDFNEHNIKYEDKRKPNN